MSETITAIYEGGILRPLAPLRLPEHTRVQLRIITRQRDEKGEQQRVHAALLAAGVIAPRPPVEQPALVSDEQLASVKVQSQLPIVASQPKHSPNIVQLNTTSSS